MDNKRFIRLGNDLVMAIDDIHSVETFEENGAWFDGEIYTHYGILVNGKKAVIAKNKEAARDLFDEVSLMLAGRW